MGRLTTSGSVETAWPTAQTSESGRWASFVERHFAVLFGLPAFVLVAAITVVPIAVGIAASFSDYNLNRPDTWHYIGLDNYAALLSDPEIAEVLINTFVFVVGALIFQIALGLLFATLLARRFRGVAVFRLLYMLPLLVAGVVLAIAWKYLLNESFGWVNYFLGLLRLPEPQWLSGNQTALPSVILADSWTSVPLMATILLAGLLGVKEDLIDAARIDGASAWQIFLHIKLPSIAPVITIAVLFQTVNLFRRFELIQILTGGGPGLATMTLNYYVYQTGFLISSDMGYANAISVLLVACMLLSLFVIWRLSRLRR